MYKWYVQTNTSQCQYLISRYTLFSATSSLARPADAVLNSLVRFPPSRYSRWSCSRWNSMAILSSADKCTGLLSVIIVPGIVITSTKSPIFNFCSRLSTNWWFTFTVGSSQLLELAFTNKESTSNIFLDTRSLTVEFAGSSCTTICSTIWCKVSRPRMDAFSSAHTYPRIWKMWLVQED